MKIKTKKWQDVRLWQLATADEIAIDGDKHEVVIIGDFIDMTSDEQQALEGKASTEEVE